MKRCLDAAFANEATCHIRHAPRHECGIKRHTDDQLICYRLHSAHHENVKRAKITCERTVAPVHGWQWLALLAARCNGANQRGLRRMDTFANARRKHGAAPPKAPAGNRRVSSSRNHPYLPEAQCSTPPPFKMWEGRARSRRRCGRVAGTGSPRAQAGVLELGR